MGPDEYKLCEALEDWREQKTRETHGESHLMDIGPSLVMPDEVLDRIVACAHYLKIKSVEDLKRETHWSKTNQFGIEVISLIHHIIPVPTASAVLTTTPLQPRSIPQTLTSLPEVSLSNLALKKHKCSACGVEGHNRML